MGPVLRNFSMEIPAGKKVAIIGHPGCGKSTIAGLLMRFYDVQKGQILIDGKLVQDFDEQQLRHQIGFVPQDPVLFSGTIRDNIVFGDRNASDSKVKQYAELANALEFIESDYEQLTDLQKVDKMRQWLREVCAQR